MRRPAAATRPGMSPLDHGFLFTLSGPNNLQRALKLKGGLPASDLHLLVFETLRDRASLSQGGHGAADGPR